MLLNICSEKVYVNDDLDVVIVTADSATFTHTQSLRRKMIKEDSSLWSSFRVLSEERVRQAKDLAVLASRKELSLFIGAGVSIGAGGYTWMGLLWMIESDFRKPYLEKKWKKNSDSSLRIADDLKRLCDKKKDKSGVMMRWESARRRKGQYNQETNCMLLFASPLAAA